MTGMYNSFFGFRERPFQLVPNPAYLYLSRSHEEAMAHLIYAISQGDGFVEITGEVGTGKTTLCRTLLENLDRFTEGAYIFNPKLDSLQLLKAVNDEFGISSEADTAKGLIDALNAFLMKKKGEGKKALLIIDEAQNLSRDVLEQLRLLSNLETTTSKLLQIILVGQPELAEMLDSYDLRQLGQRIALSCHLSPLSYRETREYIQYRIRVASQKPDVKFTRGAYRAFYRYSRGVPRLINIACDRALLTAFGLNRKKVTAAVAKASVRELAGRGDVRRMSLGQGRRVPLSFGLMLGLSVAVLYLAAIFLIIHRSVDLRVAGILESSAPDRPKVTQKVERIAKKEIDPTFYPISEAGAAEISRAEEARREALHSEEVSILAVESLEDVLLSTDSRSSRSHALGAVLDMWAGEKQISAALELLEDDPAFFRIAAGHHGLQVLQITKDPNLIYKLNLPAVLEFRLPVSPYPRYSALLKTEGEKFFFSDPEGSETELVVDRIPLSWSGAAYIPWKNFLGYDRVISHWSRGEPVLSHKAFLRDLGYEGVDMSPDYDERTLAVIKGIQAKHGLAMDGLIGPLTRIALYNEHMSLDIPRLTE